MYSLSSQLSLLRSKSASNSALMTSAARFRPRSPAPEGRGEHLSLSLSLVMEATVKSVTRLRKLNCGVGRPLDSTPSHCLPMKKFSFTRTVSSSWMLSL